MAIDTLTAARAQMEVSLGFHMIFAALGIGLPLLMLMVGSGFALIGLGLWFWWARWCRPALMTPWLLPAIVVGSPLGFLALEAGWVVTEVGRQPWVIYQVMRTSEGVTPVAEVPVTFLVFSLLYLALGVVLAALLRSLATGAPAPETTTGGEAAHAA